MPATVVRTPRSSDGTSIYAEAVGDPRNPHVVFIHEATLSASVYDELFKDPRLTEHLFLVRIPCSLAWQSPMCSHDAISQVRYDLRCHGRSGTVKGAQGQLPHLYADDISAVVGAFGLHNPVLVAW